jgi:hypothetical protein
MAAATMIGVIPELMLAFLAQKYTLPGLTFGAAKGSKNGPDPFGRGHRTRIPRISGSGVY